YFKSKDDLIEAIADRVLGQVAARFDEALTENPDIDPADAVRLAVETLEEIASSGPVDVSRVAVQAWAEALRSERIAAVVSGAYRTIRDYFVVVCRRAQGNGSLPADADPEALGSALYSLAAGFVLQRNLIGDVRADTYAPAVRTLLGARATTD
ncbi:MAG: TetR family transcriptional regulator C-terminal domain-containing protein, partial [Nocardioidaceae bacterium]